MMEARFRVWCEWEVNEEKHCSMESEASWYLLSQTGNLWSYGPLDPPRPLGSEYTKAIPLFYTGLKDKNGKEIFEGDIVEHSVNKTRYEVRWSEGGSAWVLTTQTSDVESIWKFSLIVIGNIYENKDLLEEEDEDDGQKNS